MRYGKEPPKINFEGVFLQFPHTTIGGRKPKFPEETNEYLNVDSGIRLGVRKMRFDASYTWEIDEENADILDQLLGIYNKSRIVTFFPAGEFWNFTAVLTLENYEPWQGLINLGEIITLRVRSQDPIKEIPSIDSTIVGTASPFSFKEGGIKEDLDLI